MKIENQKLKEEIIHLEKLLYDLHCLKESDQPGIGEGGTPIPFPFITTNISKGGVFPPNVGGIAGTADYLDTKGASDTIVKSPGAISALSKAQGRNIGDPRVVPSKPPTNMNNLGVGFGFGLSDLDFAKAKAFIKQYSPGLILDDEDSPVLNWKDANKAAQNFYNQNLKNSLRQANLYSGDDYNFQYPEALGDKYNVYVPDLALRKKLDKVNNKIEQLMKKKSNINIQRVKTI